MRKDVAIEPFGEIRTEMVLLYCLETLEGRQISNGAIVNLDARRG